MYILKLRREKKVQTPISNRFIEKMAHETLKKY